MTPLYRLLRRARVLEPAPTWLFEEPPPVPDARLQIRYLGTAGFVLEGDGQALVLDPFVTRPRGRTTLFRRLRPNPHLVRRHIPRADHVLVGHAHHDHVLDAPEVCRQTGAVLVGSPDVCNVGRAAGLPSAQLCETRGRETLACGRATVRGLPARHGRVYFGRVGLPGDIPVPPPWPPRVTDLRHGLVLNWYVELAGLRVVHIDSADFFEEELQGLRCDVLCLCAIGRRYRPNYVADAVRLLQPSLVLPCHWDLFTTPLEAVPYLLPEVDLPGFVREIQAQGVRAIVLPLLGSVELA